MRRWTTPTHELVVKGEDLTGCDVYVTYTQDANVLTKTPDEIAMADGDTTLTVALTQTETAGFREGTADVQVNWIHADGTRDATEVAHVKVGVNLLNREVTHG